MRNTSMLRLWSKPGVRSSFLLLTITPGLYLGQLHCLETLSLYIRASQSILIIPSETHLLVPEPIVRDELISRSTPDHRPVPREPVEVGDFQPLVFEPPKICVSSHNHLQCGASTGKCDVLPSDFTVEKHVHSSSS
jgi:hypothetical protein